MKKLFLLLVLPLQAAAIQYDCDPWGPPEICTDDGGIQIPYAESLYAEDPPRWITHQFPYTYQTADGYINWKDFVATSIDFVTGEHSYTPAGQCSQTCTEVTECDIGQTPGPDGICTAITWGPYLCGDWVSAGDILVDPLSGMPTAEWDQSMEAEGWMYNFTLEAEQREELFVNRYQSHYYVLDGDGLPDTRPQTVFNANQHCPAAPEGQCPDGWETDEINVCIDPTIPPVEDPVPWDIPADDVSYPHWYNALLGAAQQARRDGGSAINYMAFAYRDPAANQYRYTGLFLATSLEATLDWVTTSGYAPVAYIIIHPLAGFVTTGPREYDYLMKTEVKALNPNILYFYVYTQTNQMVMY